MIAFCMILFYHALPSERLATNLWSGLRCLAGRLHLSFLYFLSCYETTELPAEEGEFLVEGAK